MIDNDLDNDNYCDLGSGISPEEVLGCNQNWADNFNGEATEDDGSVLEWVVLILGHSIMMLYRQLMMNCSYLQSWDVL